MKTNDFIVASITNPEYDSELFKDIGMDASNTQMLSKDKYLKSKFIQENNLFKDDTGNFSEEKFDKFYNQKLAEWNTFSKDANYTRPKYDLFDYRRFTEPNAKVKNPNITLQKIENPWETTIGEGLINKTYESPLSARELAQKNEVIDYETGESLGYNPNEHNLFENPVEWFKDIFRDPLVLAQYDKDEEYIDPITGEKKVHAAGTNKVNAEGKFYYETLGGRNISKKQVLSHWDKLTVDGSALNKYDFMDSDDKEKSIQGIIAKSAVQVAPLFFGGYVYGGLLVGQEILKSLPMLEGFMGAVTNTDTPFARIANTAAGFGTSFNTSMSDKGQSGFLNPEALAQTMVDVALQWQQQKFIAESFQKLIRPEQLHKNAITRAEQLYKTTAAKQTATVEREIEALQAAGKTEEAAKAAASLKQQVGEAAKWQESLIGKGILEEQLNNVAKQIEKTGKIGEQLSLMYMVGISNTDVYQDAIDAGLSKREALAVALGSIYGMYWVDAKAHLGEAFFKYMTPENEKQVRNTLRNAQKEWITALGGNTSIKEKGIKGFFKNAAEHTTGVYKTFLDNLKHHGGGFFQKSMEEGLEEVGEEVAADLSKQLYTWAAEIAPNIFTKGNLTPFGNFGERALQSFFGGAMGGGLFYGVEAFKGQHKLRDEARDKLIYLFNNNDKATVDRILSEMHKNGELGSTELGYKQVELENGDTTYVSPDEDNISQNDFIYNQLKGEIDGIYKIIKDDNLQMSDGQLYDRLTLGDMRLMRLVQVLKDTNENYQANYIKRYNDLVTAYVGKKQEYNDAMKELPDTATSAEKTEQQNKLNKLKEELAALQEEIDAFKSGDNAIDYAGRMLFEMDERLHAPFSSIISFQGFLKNTKHMSQAKFEDLDPAEQEAIRKEYLDNKETFDTEQAWTQFKLLRDNLSPEFVNIQDRAKELEDYLKQMQDLLDPKKNPLQNIPKLNDDDFSEEAEGDYRLDWGERLATESHEEHSRNLALTEADFDSPEAFNNFRTERLGKLKEQRKNEINKRNTLAAFRQIQDIIERCGGILDRTTKRQILLNLGYRQQDVVRDVRRRVNLDGLPAFNFIRDSYNNAIKSLKPDLSNLDEVKQNIKDALLPVVKSRIDDLLSVRQALALDSYDGLETDSSGKLLPIDSHRVRVLFEQENAVRQARLSYFESKDLVYPSSNRVNKDHLTHYLGIEDGVTSFEDAKRILTEYLGDLDAVTLAELHCSSVANVISKLITNNDGKVKIKEELPNTMDIELSNPERDKFLLEMVGDLSNKDEIISEFNVAKEDGTIDYEKIADYLNGKNLNVDLAKCINTADYKVLLSGMADIDPDPKIESEILEQPIFTAIDSKISIFANEVRSDPKYGFIKTISETRPVENPIIDIIKKIGLQTNRDVSNVEDLLETLMTTGMAMKGVDEFTLSPEQRDALSEAYDLLELAKAFIYSSFNSKSTAYPYPHNQLLNQLRHERGIEGDDFPVIDDNIANLYYGQMEALQSEIGHELEGGEFTPGSWRYWDKKNQVNKSLQHHKTNEAFIQARLKFFDIYRRDLSGTVDGISFDLLSGYDSISGDDEERLFQIEQLVYDNFNKLVKEHPELTFAKIMDACGISIRFFRDQESLVQQFTANLSPGLQETDLTPMDKSLYLLQLTCLSASEASNVVERSLTHADTAPLAAQQYNARLAIAYTKNIERFGEGLDWIHSKLGEEDFHKQLVITGVFITGNGGAGKTSVVLRDIAESTDKKVIAVSPTKEQQNTFDKLPGNVQKLEKSELFEALIGRDTYNEIVAESNGTSIGTWCKKTRGFEGEFIHVNPEKVKPKFKNIPDLKILAIDEATHYSTLELSILSEYCKENGVALIFLGDDFQNGVHKGNLADNINMENVFTARSPRLGVTLRDGNYQKQENNDRMAQVLKRAISTPRDRAIRRTYQQETVNLFKNLSILHYDGSEIDGDLFTADLSNEQIEKLKAVGTIGFLGSETDPLAVKLKSKGITNIKFIGTPKEMQGKEFDVMISTLPMEYPNLDSPSSEEIDNSIKKFMRLLYTISTRGKQATLFVGTGLESKINTVQQFQKNTQTNFNPKAIANFIEETKAWVEKVKRFRKESETTITAETPSTTTTETPADDTSSSVVLSSGPCASPIIDASPEDKKTMGSLESVTRSEEEKANKEDEQEDLTDLMDSALCYGDFSLRGTEAREEEVDDVDKNGNPTKSMAKVWYIDPNKERDAYEDCAVFMKLRNSTEVKTGKGKDNIVNLVLQVKGILLFGGDKNNFPENFKKTYDTDNVQYKLVMSKRDETTDHFIGYSQLDAAKMEINGGDGREPLIYRVVAEFKPRKEGEKPARITLGALANPDTFDASQGILKARLDNLNKRLEYLKQRKKLGLSEQSERNGLEARIARLQKLIDSRPQLVAKYKELINGAYNSYVNGGKKELPISDISFSGSTEIRTTQDGKELQKLRLSSYIASLANNTAIDPNDKSNEAKAKLRATQKWFQDALALGDGHLEWKNVQKYVQMSNVYIVNGSRDNEDSHRGVYCGGKAVMFVSTDPSLNSDDLLIEAYKNQKDNLRVRMLRLDNMGYSLAQMCDSHAFGYVAQTKAKGGKGFNKLPSDNRYMGVRMLIGLWNFRADLLNFIQVYNSHKTELFGNADNDTIETILRQMHDLYIVYKKKKLEEYKEKNGKTKNTLNEVEEKGFYNWAEKNIPSGSLLTQELIQKINNFNNGTLNSLKRFRLGVGTSNDFIIRRLMVNSEQNNYDPSKTNYGIYLSPARAYQFENMSNILFGALNQLFKVNKKYIDEDGKEKIRPYEANENIIIDGSEKPTYQIDAILNNMNTQFGIESEVQLEGKTRDASLIKFVPKVITAITSRAIAYSKTEEIVNPDGTKRRILRMDEDAIKRPYKTRTKDSDWDWNKAGVVKLKETNNLEGTEATHRLEVAELVRYGQDFYKMLALAFHGTTDDFLDANEGFYTFTPQSTDAYFKQGFLSDPYTELDADWIDLPGIGYIKRSQTNPGFFGLKCAVGLPKFRIKLNGKFSRNTDVNEYDTATDEEVEEKRDPLVVLGNWNVTTQVANLKQLVLNETEDNKSEVLTKIRHKLNEKAPEAHKITPEDTLTFKQEEDTIKVGVVNKDDYWITISPEGEITVTEPKTHIDNVSEDEAKNQAEVKLFVETVENYLINSYLQDEKILQQADLFPEGTLKTALAKALHFVFKNGVRTSTGDTPSFAEFFKPIKDRNNTQDKKILAIQAIRKYYDKCLLAVWDGVNDTVSGNLNPFSNYLSSEEINLLSTSKEDGGGGIDNDVLFDPEDADEMTAEMQILIQDFDELTDPWNKASDENSNCSLI